ncbi:hypothetical protein Y032_0082g1546 [Ancylostoma ceylanicum]|uniref:Uncharacterized protein n=1 Tax=Ancylostoma ceylanicum TaxID=53326 RepID=A0A016TRJ9_9BILA|nr:hypothetical protein Y032_0082g1546 [Ancylostoma ceylanicum]
MLVEKRKAEVPCTSNEELKVEERKRKSETEECAKEDEFCPKKRRVAVAESTRDIPDIDIPMNISTEIRDGVRYLAPYWAVYRTRTKGRWIGRKMVDVFAQEFLSLNKNYPVSSI